MGKEQIWVVEDEASIREIIQYTLGSCGFEPRGFEEGTSFFEALEKEKPDLVLLDIMLPGMSGTDILKSLRSERATRDLPVIMTTARGMEMDVLQAFEKGADDYLIKPFGMMEMVARIKAVLRRSQPKKEQDTLRMGDLVLNPSSHEVSWKGESLELTRKEYELLRLFMTRPGQAFSREELMNQVWETDFAGETRTVDVHIRSLRSKLKEAGEWIETVRGVGYRLRERQ